MLSIAAVREIARMLGNGSSDREIAEVFGVTRSCIAQIRKGKTHGVITGIPLQHTPGKAGRRLTPDEKAKVLRLAREGLMGSEIHRAMLRDDPEITYWGVAYALSKARDRGVELPPVRTGMPKGTRGPRKASVSPDQAEQLRKIAGKGRMRPHEIRAVVRAILRGV